MTFLIRSLSAEALKLKRTLALWMVFLAPLIVVSLQFFILYDRAKPAPGTEAWSMYIRSCSALWAIFMLPLFVTLETALISNLEHTAKSWKQLFALPVPRPAVVSAKIMMSFLLIGVSTIFLSVLIAISAKLLSALRPAFVMTGMPVELIVRSVFLPFIASWLIIAIHSWISIRWNGFALSLGVGIAAVFFAVFASAAKAGAYYPWLFPLNTLSKERWLPALVIGSIGGVVFALFAIWDTVRRDVV